MREQIAAVPQVRRAIVLSTGAAALAPMLRRGQSPLTDLQGENSMSDTRHDPERRTRERAYFLWEQAGCPEGRADEFWEQAQREEAIAAREERIDEEARESFPASDPPSYTGITGEGRRGRDR